MDIKIDENKVKEFLESHVCGPYSKSAHKGFYYKITPTALGYVVEVICNRCGKGLNITDYDTW